MSTYNDTAKSYERRNIAQLRELLRRDYGKCRITRLGEVHVYGQMPNTNQTGW